MYEEILNYCNDKFLTKGEFCFSSDKKLRKESKDVPKTKSGVYLIYGVLNGEKQLIYIGKAGTWMKIDFQNQKLFGRINNRANTKTKMSREEYFKSKMNVDLFDSLVFHWFVTYDESLKFLPAYVEAELLQLYFQLSGYKKLPKWNEKF